MLGFYERFSLRSHRRRIHNCQRCAFGMHATVAQLSYIGYISFMFAGLMVSGHTSSRQLELAALSSVPAADMVAKIEAKGHSKGISWLLDVMRTHAEQSSVQVSAF